jgi:hypothetical protein
VSDLRDIIPGYREALEREENQRAAAFLGVTELICGVEVQPLTLIHLCRLQCVGSPFIVGGVPAPADIALFLWAVSPAYHPKARFRRWFFVRGLRDIEYEAAVTAINSYINAAFEDAPGSSKQGFSPSYWSGFASMIAVLSAEFGWSEAEILNMPLKRFWQYQRVIKARNNPKAVFSNRASERVRGEWLDSINNRN